MDLVFYITRICICLILLGILTNSHHSYATIHLKVIQQPDSLPTLIDSLILQTQRLSTVNPDSALQIANRTLSILKQGANIRQKIRLYTNIGVILRYQDKYDSALSYHKRARLYCEQQGDSTELAEVLLNTGGVYQSRSEYAMAMDYYFQALTLFERFHQQRGYARSCASIGVVYCLQGNYEKALHYQVQALHLRQQLGDKQAIAHSWHNIGNVYESLGNIDSAGDYHGRALQLFRTIGDSQGVALCLSSLGSALEHSGQPRMGLRYLIQSLSLLQRLGDKRGLAVVHKAIARCYLQQRQFQRSIHYARRALEISTKIGARAEQRDAAKLLSDGYKNSGNLSMAFQYFQLFTTVKDSIVNLRNTLQITELQSQYDLAQKDRTLATIEHQRNLDNIRANNQRTIFIITTVVLLLILGLVVNGYRIKRRTEQTLRHQNEEILRQQKLLRTQSEKISLANQGLHNANNQLAEQNEALLKLNNEKNEFLGIAAHDLKNPLTNILLNIQTIEDHYDSTASAVFFEWTRSVTRAVEYMLTIIRNLLDVNKIETDNLVLTIEPIDATFVTLVADAYHFRALAKNLQLQVESLPQGLLFLADRSALQQVLENLLSNAMKFSPQGKRITIGIIPIHLQDTTDILPTNSSSTTARIFIRDEGPGISLEDQQKLFTRFARLSSQPTAGEYSTGLGLSIVKKLVEFMNGRVWCESLPEKGATFFVELPAKFSSEYTTKHLL